MDCNARQPSLRRQQGKVQSGSGTVQTYARGAPCRNFAHAVAIIKADTTTCVKVQKSALRKSTCGPHGTVWPSIHKCHATLVVSKSLPMAAFTDRCTSEAGITPVASDTAIAGMMGFSPSSRAGCRAKPRLRTDGRYRELYIIEVSITVKPPMSAPASQSWRERGVHAPRGYGHWIQSPIPYHTPPDNGQEWLTPHHMIACPRRDGVAAICFSANPYIRVPPQAYPVLPKSLLVQSSISRGIHTKSCCGLSMPQYERLAALHILHPTGTFRLSRIYRLAMPRQRNRMYWRQ